MQLMIDQAYKCKAELSAYNKGFTAYRTGKPDTDNPYKRYGLDHSSRMNGAWACGYHDARLLLKNT
jgi:hypothetical protein